MANTYGDLFEDWELAVAKNTVSQFLKKNSWLTGWEFEDLLQECLVHWIQNRASYRAGGLASQKSYMGRVLRNRLTDIIRSELTDKRKISHEARSFEEPLGSQDGATTLAEVSSDEAFAASRPFDLRVELRQEIAKARARLTPRQRLICDLLQEEASKTAVAQGAKVTRATLYDEIERIRKVFLDQGLADYVP